MCCTVSLSSFKAHIINLSQSSSQPNASPLSSSRLQNYRETRRHHHQQQHHLQSKLHRPLRPRCPLPRQRLLPLRHQLPPHRRSIPLPSVDSPMRRVPLVIQADASTTLTTTTDPCRQHLPAAREMTLAAPRERMVMGVAPSMRVTKNERAPRRGDFHVPLLSRLEVHGIIIIIIILFQGPSLIPIFTLLLLMAPAHIFGGLCAIKDACMHSFMVGHPPSCRNPLLQPLVGSVL